MSPFQKLFNKEPDTNHLRAFGCLCYVSTLKQGRTKFEPMLSFLATLGQKAYKVYNINTEKIIISRDVIFHEKHYPFHHKQQKTSPYATFYLPVSTPFPTDITQRSFTPPMQQGPIAYRQDSHVSPTHENSTTHDNRQQDTKQQDNASLHNEHMNASENDNAIDVDNTNITTNLCRSSRAHKQPEYLLIIFAMQLNGVI